MVRGRRRKKCGRLCDRWYSSQPVGLLTSIRSPATGQRIQADIHHHIWKLFVLFCCQSALLRAKCEGLAPAGGLLWGPKLGQSNDSELCRNRRRSFITFMGWSLLRQTALLLRNSVKLPKNLRFTFSIHWRNLFWITSGILCENRACLFVCFVLVINQLNTQNLVS